MRIRRSLESGSDRVLTRLECGSSLGTRTEGSQWRENAESWRIEDGLGRKCRHNGFQLIEKVRGRGDVFESRVENLWFQWCCYCRSDLRMTSPCSSLSNVKWLPASAYLLLWSLVCSAVGLVGVWPAQDRKEAPPEKEGRGSTPILGLTPTPSN